MEMLASNQFLGVFPKRKESVDIIRKFWSLWPCYISIRDGGMCIYPSATS